MGDKEWRDGCRAPTQYPSTNDRRLFVSAQAGEKAAQLAKRIEEMRASQARLSTRILGRRTAPLSHLLIPNRAPHGVTPRS